MRYQLKPVDAVQFLPDPRNPPATWTVFGEVLWVVETLRRGHPYPSYHAQNTKNCVYPGDWVVQFPDGSLCTVAGETFAASFEPTAVPTPPTTVRWCPHLGGFGPPFPYCVVCQGELSAPPVAEEVPGSRTPVPQMGTPHLFTQQNVEAVQASKRLHHDCFPDDDVPEDVDDWLRLDPVDDGSPAGER